MTEDNELPPRRLSTDRTSKHYDPCYVRVAVKFNGEKRENDVHEYDVSEGWIDVRVRNERGQFILDKVGAYKLQRLHGIVEPYFTRKAANTAAPVRDAQAARSAQLAADAKRARRAAKLQALKAKGAVT